MESSFQPEGRLQGRWPDVQKEEILLSLPRSRSELSLTTPPSPVTHTTKCVLAQPGHTNSGRLCLTHAVLR